MGFRTCTLLFTTSNNTHIFLFMFLLWWLSTTITLSPPQVSCIPTTVPYKESSATQGVLCKESERKALFTFKAGLTDYGDILSSWSDVNPNCCSWKGVTCNIKTGHVLKLNLRSATGIAGWLTGEMSSSLLELKYLEYLDLSLINFNYSKIPPFLGSLEKLKYLNLSFSSFSGIVLPHLGNLSSLQHLDLGGHDYNKGLEVESPQWLTSLSSLKHLNLNYVNLTKVGSDWLRVFNMLPMLLELHLSDCGLVNLPVLINHSNFTSLSVINLAENNFISSFGMPLWLFNLTGLVYLDLSDCSLEASLIPNEIGNLSELQTLDLSFNSKIGGHLPASLRNLNSLVVLNLGSNGGMEGRIPATFRTLCKFRSFNLGFNKLEGEINEFIDGLARCFNNGNNHLETLYLFDNRLTGTLPSSLGILVKLVTLDLSGISFYGSIPMSIGSFPSLENLDLHNNKMNGTIAKSIGQLSGLEPGPSLDFSWP